MSVFGFLIFALWIAVGTARQGIPIGVFAFAILALWIAFVLVVARAIEVGIGPEDDQ